MVSRRNRAGAPDERDLFSRFVSRPSCASSDSRWRLRRFSLRLSNL